MLPKSITLSVAALAALIYSGTVHAASIERTVRAGKSNLIYQFAVFDSDTCGSMGFSKPSLRQPKNGRLTSKRVRYRTDLSGNCKGRMVNGVAVYYTPKSGFRGVEKVRFGFGFPKFTDSVGGGYRNVRGTLTVK